PAPPPSRPDRPDPSGETAAHRPRAAAVPAASPAAPEPGYSIEDDLPAEDDPDLDDTALSGHDLIVRELGATVVEEIVHE
ncbi:DNA polymerase III subunit gamma and tau, partial [Streptomyces sp. MTZ3.1]|nr:DNA polymerase III subunit gamma and tau [Streptomyces meridianus]